MIRSFLKRRFFRDALRFNFRNNGAARNPLRKRSYPERFVRLVVLLAAGNFLSIFLLKTIDPPENILAIKLIGLIVPRLKVEEKDLMASVPGDEILQVFLRKDQSQAAVWNAYIDFGEGLDLDGRDLRYASLFKSNLIRASLSKANLSGADLRETVLLSARLNKSKLKGADLRDANLEGADLKKSDFSYAHLAGVNFTAANMTEAEMEGANFQTTNLFAANLKKADMRRAKFSGVNLFGANLLETDFTEANLQGVDLRAANLEGANFTGADLNAVDFTAANLKKANFQAAYLKNIKFSLANLDHANLSAAILLRADLYGVSFSEPETAGLFTKELLYLEPDRTSLYALLADAPERVVHDMRLAALGLLIPQEDDFAPQESIRDLLQRAEQRARNFGALSIAPPSFDREVFLRVRRKLLCKKEAFSENVTNLEYPPEIKLMHTLCDPVLSTEPET